MQTNKQIKHPEHFNKFGALTKTFNVKADDGEVLSS